MAYEHYCFAVSMVKRDPVFEPVLTKRREGWHPDFAVSSGAVVGWDEIMRYLSENGWELVNVVPWHWQLGPQKGRTGSSEAVMTGYWVFAKRPL